MGLIFKFLLTLATASPALASATCWEEAGKQEGISPRLLYAIGGVESNHNPRAVNKSHIRRTNSYGIGLMQVESSNLPSLGKRGIREQDLFDPCTNVKVGASILGEKIARHGLTWEAVGAYNASCTVLKGDACRRARNLYAWKVYRALNGTDAERVRGPSAAGKASRVVRERHQPAGAPLVQERLL